MCFETFSEDYNVVVERTTSERLFQREEAQKSNALALASVLTSGTDRVIALFDLREREGIDVASKVKANGMLSTKNFVGQQKDVELKSKF